MQSLEILKWIVVTNAVFVGVQALRVVAVYSSVYSLSPNDWRKQLPLHVWLMALSFFLYAGASTYFLITEVETVLFARILCYGLAGAIAQYGLWNVLKYDKRRYSKATNYVDPHIKP